MQPGLVSRVFIQQLNANGDSSGPRIPLQALGPWRDLIDEKDPGKVAMKRCILDVTNVEVSIPATAQLRGRR